MSYIPKDAVTQAFKSNTGVLTPNQIIELDNENKFTKYGQLELLLTNSSISSASTVDFTGLDTYGDFNVFFLTFTDLTIANDEPIQNVINANVRTNPSIIVSPLITLLLYNIQDVYARLLCHFINWLIILYSFLN